MCTHTQWKVQTNFNSLQTEIISPLAVLLINSEMLLNIYIKYQNYLINLFCLKSYSLFQVILYLLKENICETKLAIRQLNFEINTQDEGERL